MNTLLGEYQNNITDLKFLDLVNYERIFKIYLNKNNDKNFYYYNILKKITMPKNINSQYVNLYDVPSTLPLTIISHNLYKDIRLWWLIYLLNEDKLTSNRFLVPSGTRLIYIKPELLTTVFSEITNKTIYNGRHY